MEEKRKKYINLTVFILYFVYMSAPALILRLFNLKIYNVLYKNIYLISIGFMYIFLLIFIYRKELKVEIKKTSIKSIACYLPIYLIGLILMIVSNTILYKITGNSLSQNEINVREATRLLPVYMSFSSVIFAPFIEEITFRKTFRNMISNSFIYILVSGALFGLVHISGSGSNLNEYLMIIPYVIMGFAFSFINYKSENIFNSMIIHSMHNLILLIILFIGG